MGRSPSVVTLRRALLLLTLAFLAARLATLPSYLQNNDGLYFLLGVERYSVLEMRPHFPGYPVYIWAGKLFAAGLGAATGLRVVSVLASALTLWPLALLARSWSRAAGASDGDADRAALGAAIVWAVAPLPWLTGTEIFSDPLGLLLALLALWLAARALEVPADRSGPPLVLAAVLAGIMLGVRLGYASLLLPLAWASWRRRREPGVLRGVVLAFAASVGLWAGWQWAMDGPRLVDAAAAHLRQHSSTEGVTIATDPHPVARLLLLARTVVLYGLGAFWPRSGASALRLLPTACLAALAAAALPRLRRSAGQPAGLLPWLFVVPYAVGVLLSFDVGFARYSLPLVAVASLVAGVGLPSGRAAGAAALVVLCAAMASVSAPLAREHQMTPPLESQLARYAREHLPPDRTLLVTSSADPPSLLLFMRYEGPALAVASADTEDVVAVVRAFEARGRIAYATAPPAWAPEEWVPVARFCRSHFIDSRSPLELWLFRHDPAAGGVTTIPQCRPPEPESR